MRRLRFSLFSKIMFWFFLNLLLLCGILLLIFNLNFRFDPRSRFFGGSTNRMEALSRLITSETDDKTKEERDEVLKRYSEVYGVEFFLFDNKGKQLGGREIKLPDSVVTELNRPEPLPPPRQANSNITREMPRGLPPPGPPPSLYVRTTNPTTYWVGARVMLFEKGSTEPTRARLLAASGSFSGNGLFFDPTPWLVIIGVVAIISTLFWLPLVRSITKAVAQITNATEQIAEEKFDVRVNAKRTDELGRLGVAINHLASRLSGFVKGQKRFLGDISHELNSPLARMQFALSILEERVDEKNLPYVEDAKEEVQLMTKLVSELLAYSKAGIKTSEIHLERVLLLPLIQTVVEREAKTESYINLEVDDDTEVMAQPELLSRAIANLIRNAIRYSGKDGPITVSAKREGDNVILSVRDSGKGVPEAELEKLFDPFYRLESDRARATGGTGLGLAIVKTCVESCKGKVSARNLNSHGFEVNILLKAAPMK